jgi:hypothetical protein
LLAELCNINKNISSLQPCSDRVPGGASIAVAHFLEGTVPATKIMLIRHAERPNKKAKAVTAEGKRDHEELIVRGWQRSGALVRLFAPRNGTFVDPRLAQPKTIFASAVTKRSTSWRPQHTVLALADELKLELDVRFPKVTNLISPKLRSRQKDRCSSLGSTRPFQKSSMPSSAIKRPAHKNGLAHATTWYGFCIAARPAPNGASGKCRKCCSTATAKSPLPSGRKNSAQLDVRPASRLVGARIGPI